MKQTSCWCGNVRSANCTKCGAGVCRDHRDSVEVPPSLRHKRRNYGYGADFAEAAYFKGYWETPREIYLCIECRKKAGEASRAHFLSRSRNWPSDPFHRSLVAIANGVVYPGLELPYEHIISSWLNLGMPVETFEVHYLMRPFRPSKETMFGMRPSRPAKYNVTTHYGWTFPGTVWVRSTIQHGRLAGMNNSGWSGNTQLDEDGRLWQSGVLQKAPYKGDSLHLLTEVARKLVAAKGAHWMGPQVGWQP